MFNGLKKIKKIIIWHNYKQYILTSWNGNTKSTKILSVFGNELCCVGYGDCDD